MDETRSSAPGHVEATPEVDPLDPTGAAATSSNLPAPTPSPFGDPGAAGSTPPTDATTPDAARRERVGAMGRDLGERLKPVASAAEVAAVKALQLSASGLKRLAGMIDERRRQRGSDQP